MASKLSAARLLAPQRGLYGAVACYLAHPLRRAVPRISIRDADMDLLGLSQKVLNPREVESAWATLDQWPSAKRLMCEVSTATLPRKVRRWQAVLGGTSRAWQGNLPVRGPTGSMDPNYHKLWMTGERCS